MIEEYSTDFYSNKNHQIIHHSENSPNSIFYSLPLTPNSVQDWKGDEFKSCLDDEYGKHESNKSVKRLKKQKKPKKKPENSNTN